MGTIEITSGSLSVQRAPNLGALRVVGTLPAGGLVGSCVSGQIGIDVVTVVASVLKTHRCLCGVGARHVVPSEPIKELAHLVLASSLTVTASLDPGSPARGNRAHMCVTLDLIHHGGYLQSAVVA
jgi:hypothetical protein